MCLARFLVLCPLLALATTGGVFAQTANDRHVVVICVDGLAAMA